jgi:hypothetical protein
MRMLDTKHGGTENELFKWFCNTWVNNIAVDSCTAKEKADKIILKMDIEFKYWTSLCTPSVPSRQLPWKEEDFKQ